jgi:hypothetical protein
LVNAGITNYGVLNGCSTETFPRTEEDPATWHDVVVGPRPSPSGPYLDWLRYSRQPNLSAIQTYEFDGNTPADYLTVPHDFRKMRFGLCTALLGDGFFDWEWSGHGHASLGLLWADEFDNAGKGRGYLGLPRGSAFQLPKGAWRRDFEGGIALVNPTASAVTIRLGEAFRRIKGTQDPVVNDGTLATSVVLPARDGLILLRQEAAQVGPFGALGH